MCSSDLKECAPFDAFVGTDDPRQCRRRHRRAHTPCRVVADGRDSRNGLADKNTGHGGDQRQNTPVGNDGGGLIARCCNGDHRDVLLDVRTCLRPSVAELLTNDPPTTPRGPRLRLRAVSAWVVGTGVPILFLMLVAASALVVDYPGDRLAWVVLTLGTGAIASGLTVAAFTAATTADPIDEVRRAWSM